MYRIAAAAVACLGLALAGQTPAVRAADAPNLVGTWQPE